MKLVSGGKYYASAPFVTINDSNGGTGTGASATAIITNGVVTGFTINNSGSNYKLHQNLQANLEPISGTQKKN